MHGLIHWLAGAYAKKGITVNGVAPALITDTKLLTGNSEELAQSKQVQDCGLLLVSVADHTRNPGGPPGSAT